MPETQKALPVQDDTPKEGFVEPTTPESSEVPAQEDRAMRTDEELQTAREKHDTAVDALHSHLVDLVDSAETIKPAERKMALDQISVFINQLSAKMETFGNGQRVKFKTSAKIGDLFKISVGQDFLVNQGENMEKESKPYKLKFKVGIEPLGVTLGHEQYNEGGGSMKLAKKKKQYLEVTVFDNGETGVRLYSGRKAKAIEGGREEVEYSGRASVSTNKMYLEHEFTMKPDKGLGSAAINLLLAAKLGSGDVNVGSFVRLQGDGEASGGLQIMGTF